DLAELLLAIGVLGVLGAVALGRGGREPPDHLGTAPAPALVAFGAHAVEADTRAHGGRSCGGHAPAGHAFTRVVGRARLMPKRAAANKPRARRQNGSPTRAAPPDADPAAAPTAEREDVSVRDRAAHARERVRVLR